MTAAKIGLALPLQSIFVVKMRVTAGDCFAPTQLDRQPKVQGETLAYSNGPEQLFSKVFCLKSCEFVPQYLKTGNQYLHGKKWEV